MERSGRSAVVTADGRGRILADGTVMPLLGLGVWQVPDGPACVHAVRAALELGYRHIDTAQAYGNESSVGQALRESGIARDEVFITTKFHPGRRDPLREAAYSIEQLGVDYVDLYLVHWPGGGATWAWPGMEAARARSYARAIGVSNFDVDELDQVIAGATVAPVVDQVQFNPSAYRKALLDACDERGVALEAYSPLGTGALAGRPGGRGHRGPPRAKPRPGPSALVRPARHPGHHQVDPSRPHRGERAGLRLRALRAMTWRSSTRSIDREGPERHWSANGGERRARSSVVPIRANRCRQLPVDLGCAS